MSKQNKFRDVLITCTIGVLSAVAILLTNDMYNESEQQRKLLQNELDAFKINYERSAEDVYYTLEEQKYRIQQAEKIIEDLTNQLEDTTEQLEQKDETIKGLTSEVSKLKQTASTRVNPSSFSSSDINLLYRLVEAEAGGESITGRIAVANVVLNRIKSNEYPNTLREVIYQQNQFEVVNIGTINTKIPSEGTIEAVNRALSGEKAVPDNVVMFWATYLDKSHAIWKHADIVTTIGIHHFSDGWD